MRRLKKTEGLAHTRNCWPQVPFIGGVSNLLWEATRCPYPAKALIGVSTVLETPNHVFLKSITSYSKEMSLTGFYLLNIRALRALLDDAV